MFLGKYFLSSMVTKLKNEITNFCQCLDESLFEAWERYKLSIDRCPNHNMLPVTQIDTFYNGLTLRHRDTNNDASGGTFMKRRPKECYGLIENMTAHHNDWDTSAQQSESSSSITSSLDLKIVALKAEMAKINKNLIKVLQPPLAKPRTHMLQEPIKMVILTILKMEEEENKAIQSINETSAQKATKIRKLNEAVDNLKRHLEIIPDEDDDVYTEAIPLARKVVTAASTTIFAAELKVPAAIVTAAPVRVAAASTRRRKGVFIRDLEEEITTSLIIPADTKSKDKGKGIMVEEPKPLKKKQQVKMDEEYARKLHAELNIDID
nr:reverse transcriptase domain-containing protein [Tanacetum cinerariifolium]